MGFWLNSEILIDGKIVLRSVNDVKIKRSVFALVDTAVLKLPLTAFMRVANNKLEQVKLAEQFKVGQTIVIKLGYNGKYAQEYVGFINRINLKNPLELECEDWTYPLKYISIIKSWGKTTVKEILQYLSGQCKFTLSTDIPDITIVNFIANNKTCLWVLQELKDKYGLTIYFNQDNTLYAGLAYTQNISKSVKLVNGHNVIKADDLKWQAKEDVHLKVKAISVFRNGSKIEAEIGDKDGEIRTLYFYDILDKTQLEKLATAEIKRYKYSGYRGTINCFLMPYCEAGYAALLTDPLFTERGGNYFIESTEVDFGMHGGRRKLTIGIRLDVAQVGD